MTRKSTLLIFIPIFLLIFGEIWAQRPSSNTGGRGTSGSRTNAPSVASTPSYNTSRSYSSSRPTTPTWSKSTSSEFGNTRNSSGGGTYVPVQTYYPGYNPGYRTWLDCMNMLQYLSLRYSFLPLYNYMWRYAQGDSPLTQEAIELALLKPVSASSSLMAMVDELSDLVDRYEAGEIDKDYFHQTVKVKTKAIRNFAKTIRGDYFLDTFDKRESKLDIDVDKASSILELRQLCEILRQNATKIDEGLASFYEKDMSRTVDVSELQRPSFESLSKGVDKIAKTIEKSAKNL